MIIIGNVLDKIKEIPDSSINTCVTSPPYWGLRDYGEDGQIGLEETVEEYIEKMVSVFQEVWRVLRDDGTLWLNLGDSYCSTAPGTKGDPLRQSGIFSGVKDNTSESRRRFRPDTPSGLKPKDLVGIPWRVAFALQADGWYLRQDIIWSKPNPMPESVKNRCTKSHEYIFLLSKSSKYYYDYEAIKEPAIGCLDIKSPSGWDTDQGSHGAFHKNGRNKGNRKSFRGGGKYTNNQGVDNSKIIMNQHHGNEMNESGMRNKRSVWTVSTKPFPGAHFATFPAELIEPCIKAGCPIGGTVFDPFFGSGTTGLVAEGLSRKYIGIELNQKYAEMAADRIKYGTAKKRRFGN